jgi:hypothetical protein
MGAQLSPEGAPPVFGAATRALREAISELRPEVAVHEMPPPSRIAPYTFALAGGLARAPEAASGRFVLLMDPEGQSAWEGTTRFVCYARAAVEPEVAVDPLLPGVAWSWLCESFPARGAAVRALGGTVTTTASRRFGVLAADGDSCDVEVRCSWSPDWVETAGVGTTHPAARPWSPAETAAHLHAFADLMAAMAGLPPHLSGVVSLPERRA